ncbi:MAG: hypothetical protein R3B48_21940 [Kofleriaceae bacterium]
MKTLGEIVIEAALVKKADAARAGRLAESKRQPLIVVLVRDLGVDEIALVGALRRQTRVPLLDPSVIHVEPDALRLLPRAVCERLHALPTSVGMDAAGARVLRIAMADPTDAAAIAELEQITKCELEISALMLSAVDGWIERAYRDLAPAGRQGKTRPDNPLFITSKVANVRAPRAERKGITEPPLLSDAEISETAQIVLQRSASSEPAPVEPDLELRVRALTRLLVAKGVFTEAELEAQLAALLRSKDDGSSS